MLRSLYSGVSGMKNLQTKMDVISNNIANVNTVGFKSSRVMFQDIMSQTSAPASAPTGNVGGRNPRQIGLGVQIGSIDTVHTTGAPQSTGRELDFALTGKGYFVVKDGVGADLYTRDGIFTRDADGSLVNSSGMKLQGVQVPTTGWLTEQGYADAIKDIADGTAPADARDPLEFTGADGNPITLDNLEVRPTHPDTNATFSSLAISDSGVVTAKYGAESYVIGKVAIATFNNPDSLAKLGGNNYASNINTGEPIIGGAGENGSGLMMSGAIEMSNVDLANEFTEMIVASRAYQANSRSITTSDEMLQELINLKR